MVWSREEALASVIAAEAVDLPVDGANINYHDKLPPLTGTATVCVSMHAHVSMNVCVTVGLCFSLCLLA